MYFLKNALICLTIIFLYYLNQDTSHEMVVACCRFLCYFCRTSRQNQKAMFDHFAFLLENSDILLSRPSLRGSTPLDVAYSSLMENTELALALRSVLWKS